MTYTVVLIREEDGRYSVVVPALNNLATFGNTMPEAFRMAEEAILLYLESIQEDGEPVPPDDPHVNVDMTEAAEAFVYKLTVAEEVAVAA